MVLLLAWLIGIKEKMIWSPNEEEISFPFIQSNLISADSSKWRLEKNYQNKKELDFVFLSTFLDIFVTTLIILIFIWNLEGEEKTQKSLLMTSMIFSFEKKSLRNF